MIYKKLLGFQKLGITITKNKVNPHFKSGYPDLNEVLEKVRPALNELGVAILQTPSKTGLKTILHDTEDDTEVVSFIPYTNITDPQKLGGNITYYRRYALVTMLNLEAEDDDGTIASTPVTQADVRRR